MSAALRLVHLAALTPETLKASEAVRQLHRADPAVVASLHRAYEAVSILRYQGRLDEAYMARKLTNRLHDAAVFHRKLEPLHIVHSGIMRATWGEYAKVLAAVERLAEEGLPMPRPLNPPVKMHEGRYRFRCRMADGGRPWVYLSPGLTEAQARAKAKSFATEAAEKYTTPAKKQKPAAHDETFTEYCARWIASRLPTGMTSVYSDGKRLAKWAFPTLGKKPMKTIARDDLKRFVLVLDNAARNGEMSPKSAINIWGLVSKMFDDAARAKDPALCIRDDNPARDVVGPDKGRSKVKVFLYPDELTALLSCEAVSLKFRRVVALATYLGVRAGELKALRWEDIDLKHATINVHRGFDRMRKKDKATKTETGRDFTMEPNILPLLEAMKAEGDGTGRVTPMPSQSGLAVALREHLKTAGVDRAALFADEATRKPMTFHDLRATAVTWWIARGDGIEVAQERAGHENIATTQIYKRTAGALKGQITDVFPPLPACLLGGRKDIGNVRKGGGGGGNSGKTEWRRRESNPGPEAAFSDIYVCSLYFESPSLRPQAGSQRVSASRSHLVREARRTKPARSVTPLAQLWQAASADGSRGLLFKAARTSALSLALGFSRVYLRGTLDPRHAVRARVPPSKPIAPEMYKAGNAVLVCATCVW